MKKNRLFEVIRDEIINIIFETNLYKTEFPYVISYKEDKRGSFINFKVISNKEMNKNDASKFQKLIGYHPFGYGGPYGFKCIKNEDSNYICTWKCSSSSD